MYIKSLKEKKALLLTTNVPEISYEVIMGSFAYGVSGDASDIDIVAMAIPPVNEIFPHLSGHINGFGPTPQHFSTFQQHHIKDPDGKNREYDITIYSIIKYFDLCADSNPNMLDSLFVPDRCIVTSDNAAKILRNNKKIFLNKGAFHRFKGYAYQQMKNIQNKNPVGKRVELVEKFGYDTKFAYHVVRLVNECECILLKEDLDIEETRDQLKMVRNGEWTLEQLKKWFEDKEKSLDELYKNSKLRFAPDYVKLTELLYNCLEEKFGCSRTAWGVLSGDEKKIVDKYRQIEKIMRDSNGFS